MATRKASVRRSSRKSSSRKSTGRRSPRRSASSRRSGSANSRRASSKKKSSRRYGPKARREVRTEMHHLQHGEHKSRKQAIAIGLSKARRAGAKVPSKKAA